MMRRTRTAILIAALCWTFPALCLADYQRDVAIGANEIAFIETARTLAQRGTISRASLDSTTEGHGAALEKLRASYAAQGQAARFRQAVEAAAAPQIAALRRILAPGPSRRPKGFPSALPFPEEVIAAVRGSDAVETAARQYVALGLMQDAVKTFSPQADILAQPADSAAWLRVYNVAQSHVWRENHARFKEEGCRWRRCNLERFTGAAVDRDPEFRREVWLRHFPEESAARLLSASAARDAQLEAYKEDRRLEIERAKEREPSLWQRTPSWARWTLGIAGVALLIFLASLVRDEKPGPPPLSDNYGRADFAPVLRDMLSPADFLQGAFLGKSSAPPEGGVIPSHGAPVFTTPERHTLIVAATRTGKGTCVIVPTLLRYFHSMFVIDPKGENAAVTARVRKSILGQAVHVLNPWNELGDHFDAIGITPAAYNPLDVLDRNDPNAVAVADALAATIAPPKPFDKDPFWQESACDLLAAVFLWLADRAEEEKTLARARHIITRGRKELTDNFLIPMTASEAFGGAMGEKVAKLIDMAEGTYSGVLSNLSVATRFVSDPQIKAATGASSFSMEDLIFGRTTVYVVIPTTNMATQRTWLRLVFCAAMHTFKRRRREKREARCMFLIDEFPALGKIQEMPIDIATVAGYGLDMTLVVQGIHQLREDYGDSADTILNNCAWKWFCNVSDLTSAKFVSESLGNKTVRTVGKSHSTREIRDGESEGESTTYGETGRPLLRPEEVMALGREVAITFNPHGAPMFLETVDYWNLQAAFAHMKEAHPRMYWETPLVYDENPHARKKAAASS